MELIDKDALVAEIESRIKSMEECFNGKFPMSQSVKETEQDKGKLAAYKSILSFIDTLEVKEVQEEPVSEEFEKALAEEWQGYIDRGAATVDALEDNTQELAFAKGFYRGANWQKQKDKFILRELYDIANQEDGCMALENLQLRLSELTREVR